MLEGKIKNTTTKHFILQYALNASNLILIPKAITYRITPKRRISSLLTSVILALAKFIKDHDLYFHYRKFPIL